MGSSDWALTVLSRVNMSSLLLHVSALILMSGQSVIMVQGQESGLQLSYPGVNSVYDNTNYDYNYQGLYDRQDEFSLGDVSLTAFVAAFLASLIGSSLVTNISRMASMEFKPPLQIRAIPIASSGRNRALDDSLKAISDLYSKYHDE